MKAAERGGAIVNALSFDVEDYFHASALAGAFGGKSWEELPSRVRTNMNSLLDILDARGVKATMFILGWVAHRFPELVRAAARRGHEIACHGLSHQLIYQQTPQQFEDETAEARKILEDITGCRIRGYRAASFSVTRRSLWALDILASQGFEYDSSIFPIVHDRYGIPGAPRLPYRLVLSGPASMIEFPPSTMRIAGLTLPVGGGGYFRLFPYGYTRLGLKLLNGRERMPLMFYSHPWEIDADQPRARVGPLTAIRHYHNLHRVRSRLESMLGAFRFAPVCQVLDGLTADLPHHSFAVA